MDLTPHIPFSYRSDPDVPEFDDRGPIAVMDATCGLCGRGARWIARNDRRQEFGIVPIQSPLGRALAQHYGVDPADPATWLLVAEGQGKGGFDALMWCAARFGGPWRGLLIGRLLPRSVRTALYAAIARNRYRVFGRTDLCAMPDAAVQARLLRPACNTPAESA